MSLAKKTDFKKLSSVVDEQENDKNLSDKLANYFYKIENHEELSRVGKGILQEVKKGGRSFAFTSINHKNSQQKTILGLSCFFDQNTRLKIAIVSDLLVEGVFNDLVISSSSGNYSIGENGDAIEYKSFHHHFDFIHYSELIKFYQNHLYTKNFDLEMSKMLSKYDIVLWDVPQMDDLKRNVHFHYRISHFYESMTVIVSKNISSGKQLEFIKKYYSNYDINLNGVLFDTDELKEKNKRRKFLGIF